MADDFFQTSALEALAEHHSELAYCQDDVGLPYDSHAVRVDAQPEVKGLELLLHPLWHAYAAFVVGAELKMAGRTVVKYRRHPAWSRGFWLHTDRDPVYPKAVAVLGYLNEGWRASDGGLLQLWETWPATGAEHEAISWDERSTSRLTFLEERRQLTIEAGDVDGRRFVNARLLDQVVPQFNRVVFLDFQNVPSFHSVTPSHDRPREGFLQWLY